MKSTYFIIIILLVLILFVSGCGKTHPEITRYDNLPSNKQKMTPDLDEYPPVLHSNEFEKPVPLAAISTAGAEDSPFIPGDRKEMYYVFVPDPAVPIQEQVLDPTIGIWLSKYENGAWQTPTRVWLQKPGKLSLDGCTFVDGNVMLFCSAREGYTGVHWFSAEYEEGKWNFGKHVQFPEEWEVGELHEYENELYYGSFVDGGKGGQDIWMIERKSDGSWTDPINIENVNSPDNEGYPYISPDGKEMWINKWYLGSPSVWRSKKINGEWQEPELIVSWFAGEPTLDWEGNLYFVHHYYKDSVMLEADIYVAYRK